MGEFWGVLSHSLVRVKTKRARVCFRGLEDNLIGTIIPIIIISS